MATRTVPNSAVEIIPANESRRSLAIQNEDTTDSVYIKREGNDGLTVSSTDHDWKILPGGSIAFNSSIDGERAIRSRYTAIASANTPRIAIIESEDVRR